MINKVKKLLSEEGIELFAPIPLSKCRITRAYLLEAAGITDGTVIIFAVPYLARQFEKKNISAYAVPRDYHLYFSGFSQRVICELSRLYPQNRFAVFSDHSPIDERHAAAVSGLGIIGKNQMLITDKYSSYVFLGEIITDLTVESPVLLDEPLLCIGCNKCLDACPKAKYGIECLSAVTQKKGALCENEMTAIKECGCAWGCDICQEVCPHTEKALNTGTIFTSVGFFEDGLIPSPTASMIETMDDGDFSKRAYSWRKKETILRNLRLLGFE